MRIPDNVTIGCSSWDIPPIVQLKSTHELSVKFLIAAGTYWALKRRGCVKVYLKYQNASNAKTVSTMNIGAKAARVTKINIEMITNTSAF